MIWLGILEFEEILTNRLRNKLSYSTRSALLRHDLISLQVTVEWRKLHFISSEDCPLQAFGRILQP